MEGEALVAVSPHALYFGTGGSYVTTTLALVNVSSEVIGFKIKTNAPDRYGVRPNSGILFQNQRIEIQIVWDGSPNTTKSDRFLLQCVPFRAPDATGDAVSGAVAEQLDKWKEEVVTHRLSAKTGTYEGELQTITLRRKVAAPAGVVAASSAPGGAAVTPGSSSLSQPATPAATSASTVTAPAPVSASSSIASAASVAAAAGTAAATAAAAATGNATATPSYGAGAGVQAASTPVVSVSTPGQSTGASVGSGAAAVAQPVQTAQNASSAVSAPRSAGRPIAAGPADAGAGAATPAADTRRVLEQTAQEKLQLQAVNEQLSSTVQTLSKQLHEVNEQLVKLRRRRPSKSPEAHGALASSSASVAASPSSASGSAAGTSGSGAGQASHGLGMQFSLVHLVLFCALFFLLGRLLATYL